jgi:hypothetical protein
MLTSEELNRLQNYGFTSQSAAIVDALWFTPGCTTAQVAMVLICNPENIWKAYIGTVNPPTSEKIDAQFIAMWGAKLPYTIAQAAFPNRFESKDYDRKD